MRYSLGERKARLVGAHSYVAPTAVVVGSVVLEEGSSVWFATVVRGDNDVITIGARTNVQDACVLHADAGFPLTIGAEVTVGHQAMLHGCTIGDGTLIGIQAVVLNGAVIGRECIVGAGALIAEGKTIPDRSLVVGSPGRVVRQVTDEEAAGLRKNAEHYVRQARRYFDQLTPDGDA
jgi:carbonic anhydrase/acetyltransferase-like protein (isoleucine patch superfamily)